MIKVQCWLVLAICLLLQACTTTSSSKPLSLDENLQSILNYKESLDPNHPDQLENIFYVPNYFKEEIKDRFGHMSRFKAARKMAHWLIKKDGYGLVYDVHTNLKPSDAILERRGNCLSFTLLLIELGEVLDIPIRPNQVDLPDTWGNNGSEDLVFYRHVNGILKNQRETQILDLAIQDYNFAYPQRVITKSQAAALLFSNKGVDGLKEDNFEKAFHYLKLAISHFPNNPDMWVNLGAAYKAQGQRKLAEQSFLQAFNMRDRNNLAASNLERLYRAQGQNAKANRFAKKAERARKRNPYYQYQVALKQFSDSEYDQSLKSIRRAIRVYDEDHRFFGLRSKIHFVKKRYIPALKDLEKAYILSKEESFRMEYQERVKTIIARVEAIAQNAEAGSPIPAETVRLLDLDFF